MLVLLYKQISKLSNKFNPDLISLFFLQLCGIALIVVGILVQMALHKTFMIKDASASGAPILLIGVGVVIFFIAFFGCCGAWKENYCMVTMVIHIVWYLLNYTSTKNVELTLLCGIFWYRLMNNVQHV